MDGTSKTLRRHRSSYAWILVAAVLLCVSTPLLAQVVAKPGARPAYESDNIDEAIPRSHYSETVINLGTDPVGTFTEFSFTDDCAPCLLGFGSERWDFTVTVPTDITVSVNDCCKEGDRYEARCNNRQVDEDGDTDLNNHEEDCIFGREFIDVPVGTYANLGMVTLDPGDWTVRIRDVQFQCGTFNPGCAAGYRMRITFGPPSGTQCAGISSCFDPTIDSICRDESLPRDEPMDMLEVKLDDLGPQIMALEQKLDELQIQVDTVLELLDIIEAKLDGDVACDLSDPLTCDGPCPIVGDICTIGPAGCDCITPCDLSDPTTCDGPCPIAGDICTPSLLSPPLPCTCEPPPQACDQSDPMTCDGDCAIAGEICTIDSAGGPCNCKPPCDLADPLTCDGLCPDPIDVCIFDAAINSCFCDQPMQTGFCVDPAPCAPCVLGTVCPDGTPCGPIPGCP